MSKINEGDTIVFIADYYTYRNEFVDAYEISDPVTVPASGLKVTDTELESGTLLYTYRFTDIYNQNHWSEAVEVR